MINFIESDERIDSEQVWVAGFDEAIYDAVFKKGGAQHIRYKFGLENCGKEYESKQYPPYCREGVMIAGDCFEGGVPDLKLFVDGYSVGSVAVSTLKDTGAWYV